MKNLIVLVLVLASSCITLKSAEQRIYVKSATIKTKAGLIHIFKNAKIYRNPGRTEIYTLDSETVFVNKNIEYISVDSVWSEH